MILDSLASSARYEALGPRFAQAFQWLRSVKPAELPEGRIDLDGDNVYVTVYRDQTKVLGRTKWEAHRRYADIQYIAEGREAMFWESLDRTVPGLYDPEKDFLPLEAEGWVDLEVPAGQFVVFFPEDAHRPGIEIPGVEPVLKLVVKVRV